MAKKKEHKKALYLRKLGASYSQIKKKIGVSKSTLSYWLRDYPLSRQRMRDLRDRNESRIEKFRQTMSLKHQKRLDILYAEEKKKLLPLTKRELFIAGLFLYWGEGSKDPWIVRVSNSDPAIIRFSIFWLTEILAIPKKKLRISLQLYQDMDIKKEMNFWSKKLSLSSSFFRKPYIKKTFSHNINHRGGFGHGTCNVMVGNVILKERIMMGIKLINDYLSE